MSTQYDWRQWRAHFRVVSKSSYAPSYPHGAATLTLEPIWPSLPGLCIDEIRMHKLGDTSKSRNNLWWNRTDKEGDRWTFTAGGDRDSDWWPDKGDTVVLEVAQ